MAVLLLAASAAAQPLDSIIFGDPASEAAHSFSNYFTVVVTNTAVSPPQTARQCTVAQPNNIYGGNLTFNLAVDPTRRNYFSVKFWGGDDHSAVYGQDSDQGRLYLYVPASQFTPGSTNNYQIGYRHEGDYICLNAAAWKPPLPGEFFYSTTLLPLWMTQGRTNLTFKIVSTGRIYDLGSGDQNHGGNYQFNMDTNSRSIYCAYTHTEPFLNPVGEVQGTPPASTTRPSPTAGTLLPGGAYYNGISNYLSGRLSTGVTNFTTVDVMQLAKAYWLSNFPVSYQNPALVAQVVAANDYFASNYFANPGIVTRIWGGNFGYLGWAIDLLQQPLQSYLDVSQNYGAGGTMTRRQAWGAMLLASRDYGRTNRDDWNLSNQSLIANTSIYWANRGLLDLGNANAFAETNAQRYLLEAIGLSPWLGSDLPNGGHSDRFGTNYFQITAKGLSREWGYVGVAYGEVQSYAADFYSWTTNPVFLAQCIKMLKARSYFRRPSMEVVVNGGVTNYYHDMEGIGLLAWRGANESDSEFADEIAYGDRTGWALGLRCAAVTLDPYAVGYAKQMLADNEYFNNLTVSATEYVFIGNQTDSRDALNVFADYHTVMNAPDSGIRLPMSDGQPDFAWADERDGIVAVKHGGERLWIAPYWQAKTGTGINGVARFYYSTTNYDQYGVLETTPRFKYSGAYFVRTGNIDKPEQNLYVPPDHPLQAYQGERLPVGATPAPATDDQPFRGTASFYAFRFGHYLFGLNDSDNSTYQLQVPPDFISGTNLINNAIVTPPVMVGPTSTVVLYLDSATNANPVPSTPLFLEAKGDATPAVALDWSAASGATGYLVKRAAVTGGPYTTLAGVTGTNYTDSSVAQGVTYYYVVAGTNSFGQSQYNSMEASASAGLPLPWSDVDVGVVGTAGGANYSFGTFAVSGTGSDIGGRADSFNFAYVPVTNDGVIVARLNTQQLSGSGLDKVGVMMRETTNSNSRMQGLILDSQLREARFPMRYNPGDNMLWQQIPQTFAAPLWFKLARTNNVFTGYVSTNGATWIPVGTNTIPMPTSYLAGLAVCSRTISALDISTFDSVSTAAWLSPAPDAPTSLAATAGDGQAMLTWNASTNADIYNVYRSTTNGGPYSLITGGWEALTYSDSDLVDGTKYYYVVTSTNPVGESPYSNQTAARPVSFAPTSLNVGLNDAQIQLSWPANHTGWLLEAQTNAPGAGLGTNWLPVGGSDSTNVMSFPVDPANGSVFFRLIYQ